MVSGNLSSQKSFPKKPYMFDPDQMAVINEVVLMAEEIVCNYYKLSSSQWLKLTYDIKTLADLKEDEIVSGPFAQIVRYEAKRKDAQLGSASYDLYKICIQDHSILLTLDKVKTLELFPFGLYIVTHELIHVVRFCHFLQNFNASDAEKMAEEARVHEHTREILKDLKVPGIKPALNFFEKWCTEHEHLDRLR